MKTKNIIIIALVLIVGYLWLTKSTISIEPLEVKIDSLNMVIYNNNQNIKNLTKTIDSIETQNLTLSLKIREAQNKNKELKGNYEIKKINIINNSVSADMEYFAERISKIDTCQ